MGMMAQSGRKSFRNQVTGGNDPIGPVANTAGCTMSSAENFNPSATQENGSCMWLTRHNGQWVTVGCNAWNPVTGYYDMGLGSIGTIKQCRFVNYGCLDPSADNYNPSADQDWTSGGTTLCVYGGSVGTLTGTKDPKKGSRSFVGAVGDDGGRRKDCKCGIVSGASANCCAHCQDKFAVACHSGQVFWTCAMSLESITSFSNAVCGYYGVASIEQMTSDSSNMRSATGRFTSHWGGLKIR